MSLTKLFLSLLVFTNFSFDFLLELGRLSCTKVCALRWINHEEETEKANPYLFTPFSSGTRACSGQKFALLEAKIVICTIVRKFKVSIEEGYVHKLKQNGPYEP